MESISAVVLAAGKGTRMQSDLPKVLFEVCGQPMIQYVLDALQQAGVERSIAVVGYRAELVKQALADRSDVDYALQLDQLGTGHAVMMCREHLTKVEGPVVVVAGVVHFSSAASWLAQVATVRRRLFDASSA